MVTTIDVISPVSVGTNKLEQNIPFMTNPPDWLEVANDSPFQIDVFLPGNNQSVMTLTPFETNGYPITQLVPNSISLKLAKWNFKIVPSHYYSNVATETNSPTNLCTIRQLSNAEALTNHYPVYSSRMNTTVATIANNVNNTGNAPYTSIVYGLPSGDSTPLGAVNIENSGFIQQGDSIYQGQTSYSGPSGKTTVITNDSITTPQVAFTSGSISKLSISGPFSTVVGHITISHGLGAIPDFIWISINSTSTSAHNVYWNNTNSTTLDLYSDGVLQVYVLCIKF